MRKIFPLLAVGLSLCVGNAEERLSADDVEQILAQAATFAKGRSKDSVIAVTDREGFVLGVLDVNSRRPPSGVIAGAVARAGTAAFLSSNQNAFTSRTAAFIIQQHFPPGVRNTPPGPLVGVGFSNLFYSDVNKFKRIPPEFQGDELVSSTTSPGIRPLVHPVTGAPFDNSIVATSLNDGSGGVPLYKNGKLVGGIGVTGDGIPTDLSTGDAILQGKGQRGGTPGFRYGSDRDEEIALAGQSGFRAPFEILASNILLGGIQIPYTFLSPPQFPELQNVRRLSSDLGTIVDGYPVRAAPVPYPYDVTRFGGIKGEVRFPLRDDPTPGKIGKANRLTKEEVATIIANSAIRAEGTRAGIRLPLGTSVKIWISIVGNPKQNGVPPPILGVFRVGEAPLFSWDVSVQKARSALFFSNKQIAMSSRSIGFLAQRFFPPGLDGRPFGPLFGLQEAVTFQPNPRPSTPPFPGNTNLPNGLTIFPGGFPLYKNGEVVGAIGVSGDGVDQDDIIAISGTIGFEARRAIRADQFTYRGARLPYVKFPRDPAR
jgi:uncharacterized protein GlcG (DUF336 family)